jgi:hypothetical protein
MGSSKFQRQLKSMAFFLIIISRYCTWCLVVDELPAILVDAVVGQVDEVVLDVLRVVAVGLHQKKGYYQGT